MSQNLSLLSDEIHCGSSTLVSHHQDLCSEKNYKSSKCPYLCRGTLFVQSTAAQKSHRKNLANWKMSLFHRNHFGWVAIIYSILFCNKYKYLLCLSNIFKAIVVRYFLPWTPKLSHLKHKTLTNQNLSFFIRSVWSYRLMIPSAFCSLDFSSTKNTDCIQFRSADPLICCDVLISSNKKILIGAVDIHSVSNLSLERWWECQKIVLMVVLSGNFIWFGRAHWTRWVWAPQSGSERPCAWWCWTLPAVSATLGRTQWPYFGQTCGSAHHAQSPWRTEG